MSMGGTSAQPQSAWNLGDPANLFGHSSSSSIMQNIIDPGDVLGLNPEASGLAKAPGVPSVLPNLGGRSTMPSRPYGSFTAPSRGGGLFNAMAAQAAGPLFNPGVGAPPWLQMTVRPKVKP